MASYVTPKPLYLLSEGLMVSQHSGLRDTWWGSWKPSGCVQYLPFLPLCSDGGFASCLSSFSSSPPLWSQPTVLSFSVAVFFFFFLAVPLACRLLVLWPGMKPMPPAVEAQGLNHWTTWCSFLGLLRVSPPLLPQAALNSLSLFLPFLYQLPFFFFPGSRLWLYVSSSSLYLAACYQPSCSVFPFLLSL